MSRWLTQLRLALRSIFRRSVADQDLDEELKYHLERAIEQKLLQGLTPEEARHAALRTMGAITKSKEECRDMRRVNFIDDLTRDLHYALRSLRRSPGFATLAVLVMALGIGANTAVFSVVNAVLLKPLAYRDPDRIVTLTYTSANRVGAEFSKNVSIPNFQDWHDRSSSFDAMAYYGSREVAAMPGAEAEYVPAAAVSQEFFRVFAVEPILGHLFSREDAQSGSGGALLISYAYWMLHFNGTPNVLGRQVRIGPRTLSVIGVLPPEFRFPGKTDLWFTLNPPANVSRSSRNYLAVGRLKPGVPLGRAQAEMTSISQRLEEEYPKSNKGYGLAVTRMRDDLVADVRFTLYLLLAGVAVVLLIACANTATLLLGKATSRTREVGVRVALGANRGRIMRQLIAESLLLAVLAAAAGLLFAYFGSKTLVALAPASLPRLAETGIDRWVLAFTFGISLITSFLFGLVPASYAAKVDVNSALKQGRTQWLTSGGMIRMRGALVVLEIALAVALLSGAGVLIRSFLALQSVSLGFKPEHVLMMRATVPGPVNVGRQFFKDVLPKVAALPGVRAASATMAPPGHVFTPGGQESSGTYFIDHMPENPDFSASSGPSAAINVVAPDIFATLGIPLMSGRDFSDADTEDRPWVAVVNEALVRKSFAGENPIGRTIFCPFDNLRGMTIIGVVGNVHQYGPASEQMPECYLPYTQHAYNGATLSVVVRSDGEPSALANAMRGIVRARSPQVPVRFTTLGASLAENVAAPRFRTLLFGVFAALAACLAVAGVYGVMAYAVSQRSNEIGLRMALGASTGSVVGLVLRQGLALAGVGLALGLAAAAGATRLLTTMLFQVKPNDAQVYLAVAGLLGIVALLAGQARFENRSARDHQAGVSFACVSRWRGPRVHSTSDR
jgi:putative ABC transport system permease protein